MGTAWNETLYCENGYRWLKCAASTPHPQEDETVEEWVPIPGDKWCKVCWTCSNIWTINIYFTFSSLSYPAPFEKNFLLLSNWNLNNINQLELETETLNQILDSGNTQSLTDVSYDPRDQRIFWSDTDSSTINSAKLDGSEVQTLVTGIGMHVCVMEVVARYCIQFAFK